MSKRLSKDHYLWNLAFAAAARGTCDRFRGGCVVARDGILISTGYNGSAPGEPHCSDVGHDMIWTSRQDPFVETITETESHCVRTIHAEINAIVGAAYIGVSIRDCDWYFTGTPCWRCSRVIARLNPQRLFICSTQGGCDDEKLAIIEWWRTRNMTSGVKTFSKSLAYLIELGIAVNDDSH